MSDFPKRRQTGLTVGVSFSLVVIIGVVILALSLLVTLRRKKRKKAADSDWQRGMSKKRHKVARLSYKLSFIISQK